MGRAGRREFLVGAAASVASVVTGCSTAGAGNSVRSRPPASPTTQHTALLSGDPFQLGVASGDPLHDRVILWTRLAPAPLESGLAGMRDDPVEVGWQVATDERFTKVVSQGVATAMPGDAHSVHVDAEGLEPVSDYFYRFQVGDWTSPVGRTRTSAEPGAQLDRLGLAVVTCQAFGTGYYAAYRHLLDEDIDLIVHLGDYIYDAAISTEQRKVVPDHDAASLDDFRLRYATYRMDRDLQSAHQRFPFMCMWDDHEVTNNYTGDSVPGATAADAVREMRAAAYRAYWEHLPLRLGAPNGAEMTLYREATFGDLARLYLLDERQYADKPPCRAISDEDYGDCPERGADGREYLGDAQLQWFDDAVAERGVTWNLVGNPTAIAGIDLSPPDQPPTFFLETWDGYPAARRRFLERLAGDEVPNPVLLTGDWHAGMVNDVHLDPEDRSSRVVATELMTPAISSPVGGARLDSNPHIRHVVSQHGYMTLEVTPDQVTAAFRVLDDVWRQAASVSTNSVWRINEGGTTASPVS